MFLFFFNPVLRGKVSRKKEKIFVLNVWEIGYKFVKNNKMIASYNPPTN